ncbi:MAG TPA: hypothetical protein VJ461_04935 [Candidatus Nanoarchaeia archaeon]|nr:hypothetical protein [Candidatus Nanoarchaeia archaeon]
MKEKYRGREEKIKKEKTLAKNLILATRVEGCEYEGVKVWNPPNLSQTPNLGCVG